MGTVISIEIGNYGFISEKNTFGDLLLPFSPTSLYIEEAIDESGRAITKRYFSLPISKMKDILDCTGHTLSAAQNDFEHAKENIVYISREIEDIEIDHQPTADEVEQFYSFDEWRVAVNKYALILANDIFDYGTCKYLALEKERKKPLTISEKMVMDLLAEIILTCIDSKLQKWSYVRAIDDYTCYVDSYEDGQRFLTELGAALREYDLSLNHKKTEILELPLAATAHWQRKLNMLSLTTPYGKTDFSLTRAYLDHAIDLMERNKGNAAILKYAIKVLSGKDLTHNAKEYLTKTVLLTLM